MKIVCFMPVLSELDILPWTVRAMQEQGVNVHCIDGWSTDGSWEAMEFLDVTRERFPAEGPAKEQVCRAILHRIEDLAEASDADWCIYSDADEIRRPKTGETLHDAIARLDAKGYNAIDHDVYEFVPTDEGWSNAFTGFTGSLRLDGYKWFRIAMAWWRASACSASSSPEQYFSWYTQDEMICKLPSQKIWRNSQRVTLAHGGHVVQFPGKQLAREKFNMKHYGYRSSEQGRRKVRTRLERRCHEEHRDGWGVHYDAVVERQIFTRDPKELKLWPAQ